MPRGNLLSSLLHRLSSSQHSALTARTGRRGNLSALGALLAVTIAACGGGNEVTLTDTDLSPTPMSAPLEELPVPRGDPSVGSGVFANTCAVCHGPAGDGTPGVGPGLDSQAHAWHHPDRQIREWIANGKFGVRVNMPGYGDKLDEQAISDLIAYTRTLWTQEQRDSQHDLSLRYEEGYRKYQREE